MAMVTVPDFMLGIAPAQLLTHTLGAPDHTTSQRWSATQFRRKLMTGLWYQDLYLWAMQERDPALLLAMSNLDVSESLYHSVVDQVAVVYEQDPIIRNATEMECDSDELAHVFGAHTLLNRSVLAYGESAIVLDFAGHLPGAEVCSSLALPDELAAMPLYHGSRRLGTFSRATCRVLREGRPEEPCWDHWDVRNPAKPVYQLKDASGRTVGEEAGDAYPWRYQDGEPFIPAVLYHAEEGHTLWNPWRWPELARATLENAMNWSDWREALRNSSFALRYLLDADVDGGAQQGDGDSASKHIPIAPNVLLRLRSRGANAGSAGVLTAPVDVKELAEAIVLRQKIRATHIGLHPAEIEIGGSPESGTALTIRREGQRREQRRQVPLFRRADLELLRKWAACRRIADPSRPAPPETGWSITYPSLPLTESELRSRREGERQDLELGLTSRVRVLAARDSLSLEQATAQLDAIDEERAADAAALDPPPAEPAPQPAPSKAEPIEEPTGEVKPSAALPLEPPPPRPDHPEFPYAGRLDYQGLPILVETAAGETRSGVDPDGRPWSVTMPWHYGEIEGTMGLDGEAIDAMVGPDATAPDVYVLHLRRPGAEAADEDKAYLGFASPMDALKAFEAAYTRTDILSGYTRWTIADFVAFALDPRKEGVRADAPPGSGLPEREPDPATMDESANDEDTTDLISET